MRLGVDVGGASTDVVLLSRFNRVIGAGKEETSEDILSGMKASVRKLLLKTKVEPEEIQGVFVGTTHCKNALEYSKGLAKTAIIRIGEYESKIKPLLHWPEALSAYIPMKLFVSTLSEKDFKTSISFVVRSLRKENIEAVAIAGVFSPMDPGSEIRLKAILEKELPGLSVTMSHQLGSIGFIERENAAIINAMLSKVLKDAMSGLSKLLQSMNINCEYWITTNDGSLMTIDEAIRFPIFTIGSGVANSLRGGAKLAGYSDCIVVDIGSGHTEIGRITGGHPEVTTEHSVFRNIKVNISLPKSLNLRFGGGTVIEPPGKRLLTEKTVESLEKEAIAWGGSTWTLTDSFLRITPELSFRNNQNPTLDLVRQLPKKECTEAVEAYAKGVNERIEQLQFGKEMLPIVVVGGGSPFIINRLLTKSRIVENPFHYAISNAIGACYAPVKMQEDRVYHLNERTKEEIIEETKGRVITEVIKKGARKDTVHVTAVEEFPFAYLKGEVIRIRVKAVGYF